MLNTKSTATELRAHRSALSARLRFPDWPSTPQERERVLRGNAVRRKLIDTIDRLLKTRRNNVTESDS